MSKQRHKCLISKQIVFDNNPFDKSLFSTAGKNHKERNGCECDTKQNQF